MCLIMTSSLNSRLIYTTAHTTSHVGSDSHLFPFLPPSLLQTAVPWLSKLHNPILLMPKNSYVIFFTLNIQACQLLPSKRIPLDLFSQPLPPPPYSKSPSSLIRSNECVSFLTILPSSCLMTLQSILHTRAGFSNH